MSCYSDDVEYVFAQNHLDIIRAVDPSEKLYLTITQLHNDYLLKKTMRSRQHKLIRNQDTGTRRVEVISRIGARPEEHLPRELVIVEIFATVQIFGAKNDR